jgi:transposase
VASAKAPANRTTHTEEESHMIDQAARTAILKLHSEGHGTRKIARDLRVSRNSVRDVIRRGDELVPKRSLSHRLDEHVEVIRSLYTDCKGNLVRVAEELGERHQIQVPYSTLTRFCRAHHIHHALKEQTMRIVTGPGEEMQHDTSPYTILIGGKRVKRQCASLVLCCCRMMYIQFYPTFDRFHCKLFLTEAFQYFGGLCSRCIIDNCHIIVLCGTGRNAQYSAEIEAFEKRFSFEFLAHELGHKNRSGKVERPFRYIEGNFLAGRTFKSDADLNGQATHWLDTKANVRRLVELKARPVELFAAEKAHLIPLPLHIPEVTRDHPRQVDTFGYVSLHSMRYSVPRDAFDAPSLTVRETKQEVIIIRGKHEELARHQKLTNADDKTQSTLPGHQHRTHRVRTSQTPQETHLKNVNPVVAAYRDLLKNKRPARYFWCVKKLYALSSQYKAESFLKTISEATRHELFDVNRIEAMLLKTVATDDFHLPLAGEDYERNPEYKKGASTPPVDLSPYIIDLPSKDEEKEEDQSPEEPG